VKLVLLVLIEAPAFYYYYTAQNQESPRVTDWPSYCSGDTAFIGSFTVTECISRKSAEFPNIRHKIAGYTPKKQTADKVKQEWPAQSLTNPRDAKACQNLLKFDMKTNCR